MPGGAGKDGTVTAARIYDIRCRDLADAFLVDCKDLTDKRRRELAHMLALDIQTAVDEFLEHEGLS